MRALCEDWPELEVHHDARRLSGVPKGGLVILAPQPVQAAWLNLERPVVMHRDLRLVLFCDAATSAELARRAVDFFHWISHRITCPPGPPPAAVRTIMAALRARAPGIAWGGGDLIEAFTAALPGRELRLVSAAQPYEELVKAAQPAGRSWVGFAGADSPFKLRRVQWAMAEAGRRGRVVLVGAKEPLPGFWRVHGKLMPVGEAITTLDAAGAKQAGRLAALLELEPEAIELAAACLMASAGAADVETAALQTEPMAAINELAKAHGLNTFGHWENAPIDKFVRDRHGNVINWRELVNSAMSAGDVEVAERWARLWLDCGKEHAAALTAVAVTLQGRGDVAASLPLIREAVAKYDEAPESDPGDVAGALLVLGHGLLLHGELKDAESALRRSLSLAQQRWGAEDSETTERMTMLGLVLLEEGKHKEAAALLDTAESRCRGGIEPGPDEWTIVTGLAQARASQGSLQRAEILARRSVELAEQHYTRESAQWVSSINVLVRILNDRRKSIAAAALAQEALAGIEQRRQNPPTVLLHELGRALLEQGRLADGEAFLRRALGRTELLTTGLHRAASLHELGRALVMQGKLAEAKTVLQESIGITKSLLGDAHPRYARTLHELARIFLQNGDAHAAERMLRDVIRIEESCLGKRHHTLAFSYGSLAAALAVQRRHQEAERACRRALRVAEEGGDKYIVASCLSSLATIQASMGRPEALDTFRRAKKAMEDAYGPNAYRAPAGSLLEAIFKGQRSK